MNATLSLSPKLYKHLAVEELAEFVRELGLAAVNMIVREGFWVDPENLARDAAAFVKAMETAGVEAAFAEAAYSPDQICFDPTPLNVLADNGIAQFRMGYFKIENADVRTSFVVARHKLATMVDLCAEAKVRAVYQVHHGSLVPSASSAFGLVNGLDAEWVGVELDAGNQAFEGYERWELSVGLLGEYLRAIGVRDTAVSREPSRAGEPDKGWQRSWAPLDEGQTNWREAAGALAAADFEGRLVLAPLYDPDDHEARTEKLKRDIAYLRKVIADAEETTRDAMIE